jgi:predicted Fe-Mo cluster-binding NifX family protein
MRIAMPVWEGRISPVFDVAGRLLVVETAHGKEVNRRDAPVQEGWPPSRVNQLTDLAIDVLICGGISRPLADSVRACGISVLSQTKGDTEQILSAFLRGELPSPRFAMPGASATHPL